MKIDIVTIFPEVFTEFLNHSIIKRALEMNRVVITFHNLRDYSHNKHRNIDDTPYGGGAGMLMAFPPFYDLLDKIRTPFSKVVFLSPQGKLFNQETANVIANNYQHLILLCGHYEGIDARIYELIDHEISIGDYVLTGGELPAMIFSDAIIRLLPGVINLDSMELDSLQNGLLKYPQYTKPEEYKGFKVPEILLSGHHLKIEEWRTVESLRQTLIKRPELFERIELDEKTAKLMLQVKEELDIK